MGETFQDGQHFGDPSVCWPLALEVMSFHPRMRKSPKQASLCSKKIFSSGSVPFFTLEELKLTRRRIQKSLSTSQLPPGLMGQDREAQSKHTVSASVCKHVCAYTGRIGEVLGGETSHHFSSWPPPLSLSAVSFHSGVSASPSWASLIRC